MYSAWSKPMKWRCKPYREFVSKLPCIMPGCCHMGACDPAHMGHDGGTSTKASDVYIVPMCHDHHVRHHNGEFKVLQALNDVDIAAAQLHNLNLFLSLNKGAPK